jgi:hypothetical protein
MVGRLVEQLARGSIFVIHAINGIVTCIVENRADVTPDEGARCAEEMHDCLVNVVLKRGSLYSGVVFDVRRGPAVFGPKTRVRLEKIFSAAERVGKPLAVRVGESAIQRLQFANLCQQCAPRWSKVLGQGEEPDWAPFRR